MGNGRRNKRFFIKGGFMKVFTRQFEGSILPETMALSKLIKVFSDEMERKLHRKLMQGYSGWDDENMKEYLKESIKNHVEKGDWVDVANLAAMLWNLEDFKEVL